MGQVNEPAEPVRLRCHLQCPERVRCDLVDTPMRCACYRVNTGQSRNGFAKMKGKAVVRSDGFVFQSIAEAALSTSMPRETISYAIRHGSRPGGYGWRLA